MDIKRSSVPVGDSLQGSAVAAGQPEGAVGQQVGTVRHLQDQQVAACGLEQGLQAVLQTASDWGERREHAWAHTRVRTHTTATTHT